MMGPAEAGAVLFTGLTAAIAIYALRKTSVGRELPWPYSVFGLPPGAPLEEFKKSYKTLAKKFHPDRLPPNASPELRRRFEEEMARINTAYKTVLSLYDSGAPSLKLGVEELEQVEALLREAELRLRGGSPDQAVGQAYMAAEELVKRLFKAAGLYTASSHYYDLLTELMTNDLIALDEYNTLAEIRKDFANFRTTTPSLRDAAAFMRRVNGVYLKIRQRVAAK
jgi:HEPN domain-containing protein